MGFVVLNCNKMGKFSDIVKSDIPTLVDFHAAWCGPCQTMHPILDQLKAKQKEKISFSIYPKKPMIYNESLVFLFFLFTFSIVITSSGSSFFKSPKPQWLSYL